MTQVTTALLLTRNFQLLTDNKVNLDDFAKLSVKEAQEKVDKLSTGSLFTDNEEPVVEEESEFNDNVYLNIDLMVGDKKLRITGVRLDSAYVQYTDKEHTKTNMNAASLLASINKHGVEKANEVAVFDVTITKQGETSGLKEVTDLF